MESTGVEKVQATGSKIEATLVEEQDVSAKPSNVDHRASESHKKIDDPRTCPDTTWQTSSFRVGPMLGLGALLFVLLTVPASAIVLKVSHHQAVSKWNPEPSVYLSVFTGIGNKALGFAAIQGALITWWRRAINGTTLDRLHHDWDVGLNIWSAITAGRRRFGSLAVTSLCAVVILCDGVLLQTATRTVELRLNAPLLLNLKISPEIPTNWSGGKRQLFEVTNDGMTRYLGARISSGFGPVFEDVINEAEVMLPSNCPGTCATTLRAAAFSFDRCDIGYTAFMNITAIIQSNGTLVPEICTETGQQEEYGYTCPLLDMYPGIDAVRGPSENLVIVVGTTDADFAESCAGNYTQQICVFRPVVAEYPVTIFANNTVKAASDQVKPVDFANNTSNEHVSFDTPSNSTFAGITFAGSLPFSNSMGVSFDAVGGYSYMMPSNVQARMMENAAEWLAAGSSACAPVWKDPTTEILNYMNDIMFRSSVYIAQHMDEAEMLSKIDPGLNITPEVDAVRIDEHAVFETRWRFFWVAAAVQVTCVCLVLYTYFGYWTLGREVSFSPLELAKAFDAPMLKEVNSNIKASDMAGQLGSRSVKYGAVSSSGEAAGPEDVKRRLVFDDPAKAVYKPMNTFSFGP